MNRRLALLVVGLLILLYPLGLMQKLDHDEIVHIHAAWLIWDGKIPAIDFQWRHHPLYPCLTAPLCSAVQDPADLLLLHRTIMWGLVVLLTGIVIQTGRWLRDTRLGLWSAFFLLTTTVLSLGSLEVRPDNLLVIWSFGAVLCLIPGLIPSGRHRLLLSGGLVGIGMLTIQKEFYALLSMAIVLPWAALDWPERPAEIFRKVRPAEGAIRLLLFTVVALLPTAVLIGSYWLAGGLDRYWLYFWKWSAAYAEYRHTNWAEVWRWIHRAPHVWGLVPVGLAVAARKRETAFIIAAPFLIQFSLITLSGMEYKQYLVGIWPYAAILAGLGHISLWDRLTRCRTGGRRAPAALLTYQARAAPENPAGPGGRCAYAVLLTAIILTRPGHVVGKLVEDRDRILSSLAALRFVERNTAPTEAVFDDDNWFNVVRPVTDFHFYGHPLDFFELSHAAGHPLGPDRLRELIACRGRIVGYSSYLNPAILDPAVLKYMEAHYRRYIRPDLWIACARGRAGRDGRVSLDLPAAGCYHLRRFGHGPPLLARSRPASDPMMLPSGITVFAGLTPNEEIRVELDVN